MRLREHEGVKGKRDAYPFDPRLLKVDPAYNVRDLTTPEAREGLDVLKEQIRHAGVRDPLEVRMQGDDVFVVSGHRRHKVVMELIDEGEPIEHVLVIHEPLGTSEVERTINLVLHNAGEPLKPLEMAAIVKCLKDFGWDDGQIAKRIGWKSTNSVAQHLDMLAMPAAVQSMVKEGKVSATVARSAIKEHGEDFAKKLIEENLEENRKIKGKKERATPKGIKKAAEKAKPKTAPAEPQPEPEAAAPRSEAIEEGMVNKGGINAEPSQIVDRPPPPPPSNPPRAALNGFYEAVEPFARALEHTNWDEITDDQVVSVEIFGADAKRFSQAWNQATGEGQ